MKRASVLALALPWAAHAADGVVPTNPATAQELPQVVVVGNAPLPGFGLPMNQIPASVQTADSSALAAQHSLGLADYVNANFSGITVDESAGNPMQLDVNYHGYTASPLLGTPEGLSVYVDGVRVNESFGDTVNWDLIPESAISTLTLISGSNPVFGLNTLGGALSVQTKSGHDNPGSALEAFAGSFGRRVLEAETGGASGDFDYFLTGNYFDESGWRDLSSSRVYQGFGKVGWQTERTDLDLSYTYADTNLFGNGATPLSMLAVRREASYTPDLTHNQLQFVNLTGTHLLGAQWLLSGNVYYRELATGSNNGNNNDNYASDYPGPPIDCAQPASSRLAIAYCSNADNAVGRLRQRTVGAGLQLTDSQPFLDHKNQAIVGIDYEDASDSFSQYVQYGTFAANRLLIPLQSALNDETVIALAGTNRIFGLYATDTWSPTNWLNINASARFNRSRETLGGQSIDTDISDYGAGFDAPQPLAGDHAFARLNPAVGVTITPDARTTFYANYNEASRAPTVIELGCANPAAPCGLPNDFASDPALAQVVARTVELGWRGGRADRHLQWSADVFRTANSHDIQFVATSTNQGYFDNVGSTRRQGLDLALDGRAGRWQWRTTYSLVDATYRSSFYVNAASNSSADADGNILVRPGDHLPLIPRHSARLVLSYQVPERWQVGATVLVSAGAYLHGNENNQNQAGGTNGAGQTVAADGTGTVPAYATVNLNGTVQVGSHWELTARLTNVTNRQYATAGFLTVNTFSPNGVFRANPADWTNENAVTPAAPRGIWLGVRVH